MAHFMFWATLKIAIKYLLFLCEKHRLPSSITMQVFIGNSKNKFLAENLESFKNDSYVQFAAQFSISDSHSSNWISHFESFVTHSL
jgi:hypothetical protein